jgi:hypothetical protein
VSSEKRAFPNTTVFSFKATGSYVKAISLSPLIMKVIKD